MVRRRFPRLSARGRRWFALAGAILLVVVGLAAFASAANRNGSTRLAVGGPATSVSGTEGQQSTSSSEPGRTETSVSPPVATAPETSHRCDDCATPTSPPEIVSVPQWGDFSGRIYYAGEECEVCRYP